MGSRADYGEWWCVRGPHRHGEPNEAGQELLSFLAMNEATICNTWFEKKAAHKCTWQHPGTKQWQCIDFAIMKQSQCRRCLDVSVRRGAQCNDDHQLLRMKLVAGTRKQYRKPRARKPVKRFDVAKLRGSAADKQGRFTIRGLFKSRVAESLKQEWKEDAPVDVKWKLVKTALCGSAEATLGEQTRRGPD